MTELKPTHWRKKPVVIEAYQFGNWVGPDNIPQWLIDALNDGSVWYQGGEEPYLTIRTLEGEMRANLGDWIIRGIHGEIYPCKPDIFTATYEPAEAAALSAPTAAGFVLCEAEPVGWMYTHWGHPANRPPNEVRFGRYSHPLGDGWTETPLHRAKGPSDDEPA